MNHRAGRPRGRPDPPDTVAERRGTRLQSAYTAVRVCPVSSLGRRSGGCPAARDRHLEGVPLSPAQMGLGMRRLPAEAIPRIPEPVRKVARNAIWGFGRATARWRPLPDFLVIGAQKAGRRRSTRTCAGIPGSPGPSWKEVSFFDRHWWRGEAWYRGQFPLRPRGRLVGEASPSYLFHPLAPERARAVVPDAKLVALLRDPVDRAYSQYQHEVALGREPLSFEDALAAEEERTRGEVERLLADPRAFSRAWWDHTYAARGLYAEQLERWLAVFPREQLLVVTTDELGERPAETYASILAFLGAAPHELDEYPRVFDRDYAPMRPETRRRSPARFAEPNRRLEALLGRPKWRELGPASDAAHCLVEGPYASVAGAQMLMSLSVA